MRQAAEVHERAAEADHAQPQALGLAPGCCAHRGRGCTQSVSALGAQLLHTPWSLAGAAPDPTPLTERRSCSRHCSPCAFHSGTSEILPIALVQSRPSNALEGPAHLRIHPLKLPGPCQQGRAAVVPCNPWSPRACPAKRCPAVGRRAGPRRGAGRAGCGAEQRGRSPAHCPRARQLPRMLGALCSPACAPYPLGSACSLGLLAGLRLYGPCKQKTCRCERQPDTDTLTMFCPLQTVLLQVPQYQGRGMARPGFMHALTASQAAAFCRQATPARRGSLSASAGPTGTAMRCVRAPIRPCASLHACSTTRCVLHCYTSESQFCPHMWQTLVPED